MSPNSISFSCVDVEFPLPDPERLQLWLRDVAINESCFIGRLNYHFCSDEHLLEMNRLHLEHDFYTDVITFDQSRLPLVNGDVFISIDRVRENAKALSEDESSELFRVMAHGLLHLIGYNDKSPAEEEQMREKEAEALRLKH